MKTITECEAIKNFVRTCTDGWEQGWHERNGGNLSYRMTKEEAAECAPFFAPREWTDLKITAELMKNEYFIVTGSGKYMRNVQLCPADNICIIEINDTGDKYRIVWGLEHGGRPTSELPTHIMNHNEKVKVDPTYRVIYHAHSVSIIALTFILPVDAKTYTKILWQSMTECAVVAPGGVGVVEWMVPGGPEIALATSKLIGKFDAIIWAHHGMFCAGQDLDSAFGLMHMLEKSADIYLKVLSTGKPILQTINDDGIRAINKFYGGKLAEEFLD